MTSATFSSMPELAAAMGFAGFAFGVLYFAILRWAVMFFAVRRDWLAPIALTLGRVGAAAVFLVFAAKLGAASLIAAFLGFLFARALALRAVMRAH
jgi:hypothetical protein